MPETKTKVIIVGGGIAGPVLAILLKSKGYDPIVYEKVAALADVGLSIWYLRSPHDTCVRFIDATP